MTSTILLASTIQSSGMLGYNVRLGFVCLKTLPIMTNFVNLHMLGLGLRVVGNHSAFHIYYACPSKKNMSQC
jgi:hypothetical protein